MITLAPTKELYRRCNVCKADVDIYELNINGDVTVLCPKCCLRVSKLLLKPIEVVIRG